LHHGALQQVPQQLRNRCCWEELRHRRLGGLTSARVLVLWRSADPAHDASLHPSIRHGRLAPLALSRSHPLSLLSGAWPPLFEQLRHGWRSVVGALMQLMHSPILGHGLGARVGLRLSRFICGMHLFSVLCLTRNCHN
jgi:hypothetical protein